MGLSEGEKENGKIKLVAIITKSYITDSCTQLLKSV
jgi:hypothetical protein